MAVLPDGHTVSLAHAGNALDLITRSCFNPMPLGAVILVRIAQRGGIKMGIVERRPPRQPPDLAGYGKIILTR